MKWLKRIAVVFGVLVVILALVPFFVTLNDYIPAIEKEISARLNEPVSIDNLHASALPVPHVRVDGITIGSTLDIRIGKLTFRPHLLSLLSAEKVIRSVEADDVVITEKAVGAIVGLAQRDSSGPAAIRVENIRLRNTVIKLEQSSFGPFDAKVQVSSDTQPGDISAHTRDDAVKVHITPERDHFLFEVAARAWTPPVGPAVRFDELGLKGIATGKGAEVKDVSAKLYGGTVTGSATIDWASGITTKGSLDVVQVEMKQLATLFSPKTRVSGRLDAKPVFTAHAEKSAQLADALRLQTPFSVRNGVLQGFDIAQAATSVLKQATTGGETRFDKLSGHLVMERGAYRFTQLDIASGVLAARGNVTIAANKTLSGELKANVAGAGRAISIPLTVAGTLDTPMLYPNSSALAGAAVGTAILGPGLGTAAGAKIGEMTGELFGKRKR